MLGVGSWGRCELSSWYCLYCLMDFACSQQRDGCWWLHGIGTEGKQMRQNGCVLLCFCSQPERGLVGLALPMGWQPGRNSTNSAFLCSSSIPKTIAYQDRGWKLCQHQVRRENDAHLGRRRNQPHVLGSDGDKDVPGFPLSMGNISRSGTTWSSVMGQQGQA